MVRRKKRYVYLVMCPECKKQSIIPDFSIQKLRIIRRKGVIIDGSRTWT